MEPAKLRKITPNTHGDRQTDSIWSMKKAKEEGLGGGGPRVLRIT